MTAKERPREIRTERVAVCSRSFSRNPVLRAELVARYPRTTFNDAGLQLQGDALVQFLSGHEKAIIGLEMIDDALLSRLPQLQVISKYGVGLDQIDLLAMRARGKRLGWTPGVNARSVAELVISFAIAVLRQVTRANRELLAGKWRQHIGAQLSERTVGIIGCGHVGQDVVRLLAPFRCPLLVHDIRQYQEFYTAHAVETTGLEELLARADVVTLHVPLDDTTRQMLDKRRLALMKPSAVLINTARGGLVDEQALKEMLRQDRLAGAGFDVFASEPAVDLELLSLPNFLATPHVGGSADEAIVAMGRAAINGLDEHEIPGVGVR